MKGYSLFQPNRARRKQHRIGGRLIVIATPRQKEKGERSDEHPTHGAVTLSIRREKEKPKTRDCKRDGHEGTSKQKLLDEKAIRTADPHIACMDALKEIEGNEIVLKLPGQIWKYYE